MKRALSFVGLVSLVLLACSGDPGEKGDPGAAGGGTGTGADGGAGSDTASVSGIVPGRAYLARKLDVTISGSGTNWAEGTTVDFGAGVTVDKIAVASPTALVASLTVTESAAVGPRDVTVTAGKAVSTYKGVFSVESPIAITVKGTAAQGSIFFLTAQGLDLATPFDTTKTGDGLFSPVSFQGIAVTDIPGLIVSVTDVTLYKVELTVIVDVTAAAGTKPISLMSGVAGSDQVAFPYPKGLDVAARQATALTLGAAANQTVANPFESKLFKFTPTAGLGLVDVLVTTKATDFAPKGIVLPKSGKFQDALSGFATASMLLSTSADPLYVIALDTSGGTGSYSITAKSTIATPVAEAANDTSATAQVVATLPAVVTDGALSGAADEDWYAITVGAPDANKKLRVMTAAGDGNTDTVVTVFKADGTTEIVKETDDNYHENIVTPALVAGDYRVKISYSPQSTWSAGQSKYQLALRLE